jgi:NADPH-dependent curcumin reductase CurA
MMTIVKRLTMRGFIVSDADFGPKYFKEHIEKVSAWMRDGSFKAKIHEDVGIEKAGEALVGMLEGKNFGKAVLKIKV